MPVDTATLTRAFLTIASENGGRTWLVNNLRRATLAMAAGQPKVKLLAVEGETHDFIYDLSSVDLVTVLQGAIDILDAANDDAPFDPSAPGVLIPVFKRYALS